MIEIYTDGGCIGNPGPGGWGAVVVRDGERLELSGGDPKTTNNRMEIMAVIRGLEQTAAGDEVLVVSDSQYVVNTMTKGWQRKINNDLWDALDRLVGERRVKWQWVRGHNGHPLNEIADKLANTAARAAGVKGRPVERRTPSGGASASEQPSLSHIDESGTARMVDVGAKDVTDRVAVARGSVIMQPATLKLIREGGFQKGDVLGTARIAGVMAAKRTSDLIPLCHPVPLTQVTVEFEDRPGGDGLEVTTTARASWKTGVEMEALTALSVAALTVYDMCKSADRAMRIDGVRLARKTGGKSGDFTAE